MPRPSEDEYETEATETGSEEEEYELEGNLKTSLVWDASQKQLSVSLRQLVEARGTEIKYKGRLNTVTGAHHMKAQLLKTYQTSQLSLQKVYTAARLHTMRQRLLAEGNTSKNKELIQQIGSQLRELKIDPDAFLPAGLRPVFLTDWCLSPGLTLDSDRSGAGGLRPALLIKKAPQLLIHSPRTDLMLSAKALTDFEPGSNKVSTSAGVRLKLYKFNVTSKQDLKVSVGLDLNTSPLSTSAVGTGKTWSRTPYVKVSENNTSIKWQGGKWTFQYTL